MRPSEVDDTWYISQLMRLNTYQKIYCSTLEYPEKEIIFLVQLINAINISQGIDTASNVDTNCTGRTENRPNLINIPARPT